jgi:hypothetical protein
MTRAGAGGPGYRGVADAAASLWTRRLRRPTLGPMRVSPRTPPPAPPTHDDVRAWDEWERRQAVWSTDLLHRVQRRTPRLRLREALGRGAKTRWAREHEGWFYAEIAKELEAVDAPREWGRPVAGASPADSPAEALVDELQNFPDVRQIGVGAGLARPTVVEVCLDPHTPERADQIRALCRPFLIMFTPAPERTD